MGIKHYNLPAYYNNNNGENKMKIELNFKTFKEAYTVYDLFVLGLGYDDNNDINWMDGNKLEVVLTDITGHKNVRSLSKILEIMRGMGISEAEDKEQGE